MSIKVLMPMAGGGLRFKEKGYEVSKPAILTYDISTGEELPMVVCATKDVPGVEADGNNICFVERDFHHEDGTEEAIRRYFPLAKFITVDHVTEGGACTCLLAEDWISNEDELIIAGCDNGMEYDLDYFEKQKQKADVIVFTFRNNRCVLDNPSAYGWMRVDSEENITGVSIKKAISSTPMNDHAVVATMWFRTGKIFIDSAKRMINEDDRVNGEFYVDEVVKHAMSLGYRAKVFEIDRYTCWGTPNDFENYRRTFTYWSSFYLKEKDRFFKEERNNTFLIGVAGDSGSGKSELMKKIRNLFGNNSDDLLFLEGDGEHRWARNDAHWEKYTALNPNANDLQGQAEIIRRLKKGNPIERRDYNHQSGMFGNMQRIEPAKYMVLGGLHALYLPELRKEIDLKIYMDTDEQLRKLWKIRRDIRKRGYDLDEIRNQIEKRMEDAELFISPQKKYADMIISYFDNSIGEDFDQYIDSRKEKLGLKVGYSNGIDIDRIRNCLTEAGIKTRVSVDNDNFKCISIDYDQLNVNIDFNALSANIIPNINKLFKYDIKWENGVEGAAQLFVLVALVHKIGELS